MVGVILAGGTGSRLYPITTATNKHLLPIYDKPMLYYPLSTLLMAGVRRVVVVTNPEFADDYLRLLGDGSQFGISITIAGQVSADGIVGALRVATPFAGDQDVLAILGDNFFYGGGFGKSLLNLDKADSARIWLKRVSNPREYGVLELDSKMRPIGIEEKPDFPKSDYAVTGLYYFPKDYAVAISKITFSQRGELEITSLIDHYIQSSRLEFHKLNRGTTWFDAGTPERLLMTSDFVRILQERAGQIIGSPEEAAFRSGIISRSELGQLIDHMSNSIYKQMLHEVLEEIDA
jgi:glucose-1-phosphate thymidylyltransferase